MLKDTTERFVLERIVCASDFNFWIKEMEVIMASLGMRGVLPQGTQTYCKGNMLDQIYTNLGIVDQNMEEMSMTSHKLIIAQL